MFSSGRSREIISSLSEQVSSFIIILGRTSIETETRHVRAFVYFPDLDSPSLPWQLWWRCGDGSRAGWRKLQRRKNLNLNFSDIGFFYGRFNFLYKRDCRCGVNASTSSLMKALRLCVSSSNQSLFLWTIKPNESSDFPTQASWEWSKRAPFRVSGLSPFQKM